MTSPSAQPQLPCPLPDQLRSFSTGDLQDDELIELIGSHLEECPQCLEQVERQSMLTPLTLVQDANDKEWAHTVARELKRLPRPASTPQTIGKYPIHQVLAHGGMSTIYESVHPALECPVVVKALSGLKLLSVQARERLLSEQLVFGKLRHETIVSVLDAGQDGDIPYIVMERLQGQTLSQWIKSKGPQSVAVTCAIGAVLAEALEAIHTAGFVHCDVKPNNIMLTDSGRIKLLDFGLAAHMTSMHFDHQLASAATPLASDETSSLHALPVTAAKEVVGTPNFIPPEHLFGDSERDARSDLYGLGVTLIYLLSGKVLRTPSDDRETANFLNSQLPHLSRSLCSFLSRLVSVRPENRPRSAAIVQTELTRYVRDPRCIHLSHSVRYEVTTSLQHRRLRNITIATSLLAASLMTGIGLRTYYRPQSDNATIEIASSKFLSLSAPIRPPSDRFLQTWPTMGMPAGGLLPLIESANSSSQPQLETYLPRPGTTVACWNHQGDRFACFGSDGSLRVFEASASSLGKLVILPAFPSSDVELPLIAWSASDQVLAVAASVNDGIQFWDIPTRRLLHTIATEVETVALTSSPSSDHILAGNVRGELQLYDQEGRLTKTLSITPSQPITGFAWSADRRLLAAIGAEGALAVIDGSTWEIIQATSLMRPLQAVTWCSTNNHLALGTDDGIVIKIDSTLQQVAEAKTGAGRVVSLDWDQTTDLLAVGSETCIVTNSHLEPLEELAEHQLYTAHRVHWNNGRLLIAAKHHGLHLFDEKTRESHLLLPSSQRQILSLAWHPTKDLVAVGTMGGTLLIANQHGVVLSMAKREQAMTNASSLRWSPDGRHLAGASSWGGKQLRIWNQQGEVVQAIEADQGCLTCDWLADGQFLAAGGENGVLTIYRTGDGQIETQFNFATTVRTLDCHPTEPMIAVGTEQGCHLMRLTNSHLEEVTRWERDRSLRSVAFSPSGDRLAIAESHSTISVLRYPSEHVVQRRTIDWWLPQEIKWNRSGTQLACGNLGVLDANALHTLSLPTSSIGYDYAWSLNDAVVVSGDWFENIACFHGNSFQPIWQMTVGRDGGTVTLDNQGRVLDQHGPGIDLMLLTPNPAGGFDTSPLPGSR